MAYLSFEHKWDTVAIQKHDLDWVVNKLEEYNENKFKALLESFSDNVE